MRLKYLICPHGNHDVMNDVIRKNRATVKFYFIRIILSMTTFNEFRLRIIDITDAYLQSGPTERTIFVSTTKEWSGWICGKLWEFPKISYGITEAGMQSELVL